MHKRRGHGQNEDQGEKTQRKYPPFKVTEVLDHHNLYKNSNIYMDVTKIVAKIDFYHASDSNSL